MISWKTQMQNWVGKKITGLQAEISALKNPVNTLQQQQKEYQEAGK